jgi:hypothetical protein
MLFREILSLANARDWRVRRLLDNAHPRLGNILRCDELRA